MGAAETAETAETTAFIRWTLHAQPPHYRGDLLCGRPATLRCSSNQSSRMCQTWVTNITKSGVQPANPGFSTRIAPPSVTVNITGYRPIV